MSKPRHVVAFVLYMLYCFSSGSITNLLGLGQFVSLLLLIPFNLWLGLWLNKKGYFG